MNGAVETPEDDTGQRHARSVPLNPADAGSSSPEEGALFNRYKLIRDEIAHEDSLMSARLSWFMASQSFLLTALAIAQGGGQRTLPTMGTNYLFPLVPLIAISSSLVIFAGVLAGIWTLRRWRAMLDVHYPPTRALPRIRKDEFIIRLSWSAPICLPLIFLAAWCYLLAVGLMR